MTLHVLQNVYNEASNLPRSIQSVRDVFGSDVTFTFVDGRYEKVSHPMTSLRQEVGQRCFHTLARGRFPQGGTDVIQGKCSVEGCERVICAKGLCNMHYSRQRLTGTLGPVGPYARRDRKTRGCDAAGCSEPHHGYGMCESHFEQALVPSVKDGLACSVAGCLRAARSSGLCEKHYLAQKRNGHTISLRGLSGCSETSCERPHKQHGLCGFHSVKYRASARAKAVAEIKMMSGCVDCGYNAHPSALHLDHVRGVKCREVSQMMSAPWEDIFIEIDKCDVRCANCHAIKTWARQRAYR